MLDAPHQNEAKTPEIVDSPAPSPLGLQPIDTAPPRLPQESGQDVSHQLSDVVSDDIERVAKDVVGSDRSLVTLLSKAPKVVERILSLQEKNPELLLLDEQAFKRDHRDLITLVTQRIRMALWQEFESAIQNNRQMRVSQIFAGTCSESAFYNLVDNPIRLAYILCAPADYIVMLKEAHAAGLEKLREIFSAQIVDADGYMNPKAADMVLKAYALLDARLKGAIIQRVDQRTVSANLQISAEGGKAQQIGLPTDMSALEQQLAQVRAQLAKYTQVPHHPTPMQIEEMKKDVVIDMTDMNVNKNIGGHSKVLR